MKYIIVDSLNLFYRARHVLPRGADAWTKTGFALHLCFNSVTSIVKKFGCDHVVFVMEGRSWRKDVYAPYKKNREEDRAKATAREVEEDQIFMESYVDMMKFLSEKTNVTVLQQKNSEGDDCISRFVQLHPQDEIIINSSDTDFYQLLSDRVTIYNGVTDELHTIKGIFKSNGSVVIDKKTKLPKVIPDPKWLLFEKCIRGDGGDNIFSAFPGVRLKGSKNKVGLIEAWEDHDKKGFAWNTLMLSRWSDHDDVDHRVMDDYERNRMLIDLTQQPQWVLDLLDDTILTAVKKEPRTQVGIHFLKFCGKHELVKLSDLAGPTVEWMNMGYRGVLLDK